ncbi:MAG: hypothetical protein SFW66_01855 [Gammaproteobacteria bacterium]|nr:hypothetical protein [Gammaproteobacteria bacterium]
MKNTSATPKFFAHLMRNIFFGLLFIVIAQYIGMLGYHFLEHMSWIDAFVNAAMILSGMGPLTQLHTYAGKVFAGFYALFSGLAFIAVIALIFAPVVHRFFRKIHLDSDKT